MAAQRFAVVMAGGAGTRFWPASRSERPKQFLPLAGGHETLLQATVRRAAAVVGAEHVLVVGASRHAALIAQQLPQLPPDNVLLEPVGRNTAPCLAWASAWVRRRAKDAAIAALPADAHIADEQGFTEVLSLALAAAESGSIVTIGIRPTRPETGYGYLELGEQVSLGVRRVHRFVEKPDRARAEAFVSGGQHLWNCGMFCFRADVLLDAIARHLPELSQFVVRADQATERGDEQAFVSSSYANLQSISIDYGVMERSDDILVVPGSFGWDDVGGWAAAYALATKDAQTNAGPSERLAVDANGCYVRSREGKLVVLVGVQDLVVVDTDDALLVVPRDRAQDVSKVVEALKRKADTRHL
jgi:mannose-1-phosphate guanylyltransferase